MVCTEKQFRAAVFCLVHFAAMVVCNNVLADAVDSSGARKTDAGTAYCFFGDIQYAGTNNAQKLDVWQPLSDLESMQPVVMIIHGGGWAIGDKAGRLERDFAAFCVDEGYLAVSVNYTLTVYEADPWKSRKIKGAWPQNIYDCKKALQWVCENAEKFGGDKSRIAVMGASAGGHLALLTGLSADNEELNSRAGMKERIPVCCIVDFYGIPDIRKWGGSVFIDASRKAFPEVWSMASPVEHLSPESPPVLIVHGTEDPTVKIELSEEFVRVLESKNVLYRYVAVESAVHSFGMEAVGIDLKPVVGEFLEQNF